MSVIVIMKFVVGINLTRYLVYSIGKSEIAVDDPQICSWIPEDVRNSISSLQEQLEEKKNANVGKNDPVWKEKVQITVS